VAGASPTLAFGGRSAEDAARLLADRNGIAATALPGSIRAAVDVLAALVGARTPAG
jgi:hypothetical protein